MEKELLKVLIEMKNYIEDMEVTISEEFGGVHSFEELVKLNEVPELYWKVLELLGIKGD